LKPPRPPKPFDEARFNQLHARSEAFRHQSMTQPAASEPGIVHVGIGLIQRGDRFLVRQRPAGAVYAGYWEFPGGKCEPGETPAEATARECLEETGLVVVVGALRRIVDHHYRHGRVRLFFFDCMIADPSAEPPAELGCRWIRAGALLSLQFPEANEAILEELASRSG
jgi:8-oxo-dGTP diphosphatase